MEDLSFNEHINQAEEAIEYSPQLALQHIVKAMRMLSRIVVMQHDAIKEEMNRVQAKEKPEDSEDYWVHHME